jgi:Capsular polysaccharide synthesis protein
MTRRIIWQYWETRGTKPKFIDGLRELAKKNSGVEIVLVTPQALRSYLPELPDSILQIEQLAHKADMIRTMLVMQHGGMWLDSDALVLRDLNWLFDLLAKYEFVGFNDAGKLKPGRPWVRINCFLSCANGTVVSEWVRRQHAILPRTVYQWEEIGSALLHPICLENRKRVKILPFETICPVPWDEVGKFKVRDANVTSILKRCPIVMLSNHTLAEKVPSLQNLTVEEIAEGDYLLSAIMRHAIRPEIRESMGTWLLAWRRRRSAHGISNKAVD